MNKLRCAPSLLLTLMLVAGVAGCQAGPRGNDSPPTDTTPTAAATPPAGSAPMQAALNISPLASGLTKPLAVTHAGDGSGDLYVLEQRGTVRVIRQGALDPRPFLDLTSLVRSTGNEQGLLGLAFHPEYRRNGLLFVNYSDTRGNTVIARYAATADRRTADPATARTLLTIEQPFPNHNGGMLLFGPDGKLWIGTGDGGSGGDPQGNGQNGASLLGKMLRIDVDAPDAPYGIPSDNPFLRTSTARQEVWGLGLRNPWRYSFDRQTGDLWVADVGQNSWEEVSMAPAGTPPPVNFGWNIMEATHCFPPQRTTCNQQGLLLPVTEYRTGPEGCSVTGGHVYRGRRFPQLNGLYVFGDYCRGVIWTLRRDGAQWVRTEAMAGQGVNISSFGEDENGELYLTGHNTGTLYRVEAR